MRSLDFISGALFIHMQEVSREFKSTLEREIGLDDISTQNTYSSSKPSATSTPSSTTITEDSQAVVDLSE